MMTQTGLPSTSTIKVLSTRAVAAVISENRNLSPMERAISITSQSIF
jgi:hypothetical protein